MKTYTELIKLPTFRERFLYLKVPGIIGEDTFGDRRWLNQKFYTSPEWRSFRHDIIARDFGRDLAVLGYEMTKGIIIHHLNPLTIDDVLERRMCLFDPENVVCVSDRTHKAIHFGSMDIIMGHEIIERQPGDTKLW